MRTVAALVLLLHAAPAIGDGGTVRASEVVGGFRVTVFTNPTPLRAGPADVSVLVQDARTGAAVPGVRVTVRAELPGQPWNTANAAATPGAATNKLMQAALMELPAAGEWQFTVTVAGEPSETVRFAAAVGEPLPKWRAVWPWVAWPAAAVALFAAHRRLAAVTRKGL
jgi:hypothetical protein